MNKLSSLKLALALGLTLSSLSSFAVSTTYKCKVTGVFENELRNHLRCDKAAGTISFFAVPQTKANHAKSFLSVATAAMLAGRTVEIFYDTNDTSGTQYGCGSNDCRYANAVEMQ